MTCQTNKCFFSPDLVFNMQQRTKPFAVILPQPKICLANFIFVQTSTSLHSLFSFSFSHARTHTLFLSPSFRIYIESRTEDECRVASSVQSDSGACVLNALWSHSANPPERLCTCFKLASHGRCCLQASAKSPCCISLPSGNVLFLPLGSHVFFPSHPADDATGIRELWQPG